MKSLNRIEIKGTVGSEPRINQVGNGTVGNFSVVTEYAYQSKNEWVNETTWHNVVAWEGFGKCPLNELHKGTRVYVCGRLRQRKYTNREGQDVLLYEILADEVDIINDFGKQQGKNGGNNGSQGGNQYSAPTANNGSDDLPF